MLKLHSRVGSQPQLPNFGCGVRAGAVPKLGWALWDTENAPGRDEARQWEIVQKSQGFGHLSSPQQRQDGEGGQINHHSKKKTYLEEFVRGNKSKRTHGGFFLGFFSSSHQREKCVMNVSCLKHWAGFIKGS